MALNTHTANVFLPGCLGPVKREIVLAEDAEAELAALREENKILREGMKGDYDLDAWLDWSRESKVLRKDLAEMDKENDHLLERTSAAEQRNADRDAEIAAQVESALRRSFTLGQVYWQQADSDSTRQQNKSDQTMETQAQNILNVLKSISAALKPTESGASDKFASDGVPRELLERLQAQTELGNDWDEVQALLAAPVVERQPVELAVWYGSMPESNGKTNWTAILHRKGESLLMGVNITLDRSEYPDRVRYEADRMRYLIGELPEEPDMMAYDEKLHSGYVRSEQPAPVAVVLPERKPEGSWIDDGSGHASDWHADPDAKGWNACLDKVKELNQ